MCPGVAVPLLRIISFVNGTNLFLIILMPLFFQCLLMRYLFFCLFLLMLPLRIFPQVVINEFSSSNISLLEDEDRDYNDWIELYNNSSSAKNMMGYYLSDDQAIRKKWKFPAVTINPFSYLIVFASGKNRTDPPETYTTIIPRNAVWQYLVPASEPNSSWKNHGFDATGWNTGASGFGYGDNDDSTIIDKVVSVYLRKEFTLTGIGNITGMVSALIMMMVSLLSLTDMR
jgi:hypothetical protein